MKKKIMSKVNRIVMWWDDYSFIFMFFLEMTLAGAAMSFLLTAVFIVCFFPVWLLEFLMS